MCTSQAQITQDWRGLVCLGRSVVLRLHLHSLLESIPEPPLDLSLVLYVSRPSRVPSFGLFTPVAIMLIFSQAKSEWKISCINCRYVKSFLDAYICTMHPTLINIGLILLLRFVLYMGSYRSFNFYGLEMPPV